MADKLKADNGECDWLKGKAIVLFFPESSIRTRVSFEKGIKMLGGDTILFPPEALDKKEDIKDVIGYLENWADMVIVRHKDLSLIEYMAEHSHIPIINVTDPMNCHGFAHMNCHQIDWFSVISPTGLPPESRRQ